jgi:hypothetical protein
MENFDKIIDNEKEWRKYIIQELKELRKDYHDFKFEVTKRAGFLGALSALAVTIVATLIRKAL